MYFQGSYFLRDSQGKRAFVHNDCHKCNLNRNIGFFNTLVAYERFTAHKGIMILANIAKMAVLVFLMKAGVKSVGVVTVNLIATAATRLFYVCYVFFKLKLYPSFKKIDTSFVKGVLTFHICADSAYSAAVKFNVGLHTSWTRLSRPITK